MISIPAWFLGVLLCLCVLHVYACRGMAKATAELFRMYRQDRADLEAAKAHFIQYAKRRSVRRNASN